MSQQSGFDVVLAQHLTDSDVLVLDGGHYPVASVRSSPHGVIVQTGTGSGLPGQCTYRINDPVQIVARPELVDYDDDPLAFDEGAEGENAQAWQEGIDSAYEQPIDRSAAGTGQLTMPQTTTCPTLRQYAETALWSSHDYADESGGEPLDRNYGPEDIAPETMASMAEDVSAFLQANATDLVGMDADQIGHDFWLTRNHHGAGFWDRGLGALGDRLTAAAHAYGSFDLYVGDDGLVYGQ